MPPPRLFPLKAHPWGGGCACTTPACARSLAPIGDCVLHGSRASANGLTEILVSRREKHALTTLPGARLSSNMVPAAVGGRLAPGRRAGSPLWGPSTCSWRKNFEKIRSCAQTRCWLHLAPLSTRTALRTNPLGDLGGSTELAEPPLVGNARIPRRTRSRHYTVIGMRWARKAVGSAPACPLPCRTLTLLVPSPRARLPGLGEETWSRTATSCS